MGKSIRRSALAVAAGATALAVAATPALAAGITPFWDGQAPGVNFVKSAYRISGLDRYEVSANAAKLALADRKASGDTFIVASGLVWPDAISATPLSGCYEAPVLLVGQSSVPTVVADLIRSEKPSRIVISGGPATVDPAVEAQLKALSPGVKVERNGGADRYQVAYNNAAETAACYKQSRAIMAAHDQLQKDTEAEARYQSAVSAYDKAYADYGVAKQAYDASVAKRNALYAELDAEAAKLVQVPAASVGEYDAAFAAWQIASAKAAAVSSAKAFIVNVLGAYPSQGTTTLTLESTLGQYRAILTDAQKDELNKAEATLGLTDATKLNAAIAAANAQDTVAADNLAAKVEALAVAQRKLMDQADAIAANKPILENMGLIQRKIDAAKAEVAAALSALNKAGLTLGTAQAELADAMAKRPRATWLADDLQALDSARDNAVRGAGATPAFLATGRVFTDALATGPAAANTKSVVLLTQNDVMGTWAQKWVTLSNSQLVSVGGDAIKAAGDNVTYKVPGADRYEVSVKLAEKFFKGSVYPSVASGEIYSDATVGGSFSALYHNPLVLTRNASLPDVVDNYLRNHNGLSNPSMAVVLGGPGTILPSTFTEIQNAITNS